MKASATLLAPPSQLGAACFGGPLVHMMASAGTPPVVPIFGNSPLDDTEDAEFVVPRVVGHYHLTSVEGDYWFWRWVPAF